MPSLVSSTSNNLDLIKASNVDFTGPNTEPSNTITTNGQLIIGSTLLNAGGTHINIGILTSPDSSILIGYASPNITLKAGATTATTYTEDSGTATPALNNLNILGGPGVTTTGSGSTVTINSVVFTDTTAATLSVDNGYFATAAGTYTLPASPAQGELVIVYCDTTGAVAVTANTGQKIRLGNSISSTAGSATSTAQGDCLTLRYRTSGATWMVVSSMGNWTLA